MKRISKVVLLGGLAFTLAIGVAPAQQINEIFRGAVNGIADDLFSCGRGNSPCDLGYKMYCELDPSDVSGLGNPVDGIPSYRRLGDRYLSDAAITGNFPVCGTGGPGNSWYILWDGQLGSGTSAHTGWYGAQAQRVNALEIGNSLSFNCLPVTGSTACFAALSDLGQSNDTILSDGTPLNHVGGISPVPVPQLVSSVINPGLDPSFDTVQIVWEGVANKTILDSADDPIESIDVLWITDTGNVTDADWAASGRVLASLPSDATELEFLRGDGPAFEPFLLANRLTYAGGHQSFVSANSVSLDLFQDFDCFDDSDDAAAIVNIERVCLALRSDDFGKEFIVVLLDLEGAPAGQVLTAKAKYEITMNTEGGISNMQVRANALAAAKTRGGATVLRFNTNFDNTGVPDRLLSENSSFNESSTSGWIMFGVPLSELVDGFGGGSITDAAGTRVVTFSGTSRVPGAVDTFPNDGGGVSFTF